MTIYPFPDDDKDRLWANDSEEMMLVIDPPEDDAGEPTHRDFMIDLPF